ncbi:hypothetical protein LTR95_014358 [Oleoguttula sp. CCFEE 5521]
MASAALTIAHLRQRHLDKALSGPCNQNPCLRCLDTADSAPNVHEICRLVGVKEIPGVVNKCLRCQAKKGLDCMQIPVAYKAQWEAINARIRDSALDNPLPDDDSTAEYAETSVETKIRTDCQYLAGEIRMALGGILRGEDGLSRHVGLPA